MSHIAHSEAVLVCLVGIEDARKRTFSKALIAITGEQNA